MKRFAKLVCTFVALAAVVLAFDYYNVTRKERLLSNAVSEIGGRSGSIPVWPLGTEYRITLTAVPNAEQLDALKIANRMRGSVGIAFEDCYLDQGDVHRLKEALPNCHLFVVRDGEMTSISNLRPQGDGP